MGGSLETGRPGKETAVLTMQTETKTQPTPPSRTPGLGERIEVGFEETIAWCSEHWSVLLTVFVVFLLGAGVAAAIYEYRRSELESASTELAAVERELRATAAPLDGAAPANPELVTAPRKQAIEALEKLEAEEDGSSIGVLAELRRADLEVELGELEAADATLSQLVGRRAVPPLFAATAHRLHGYVLEELNRPLEAAEAYLRAAKIADYPARADAYWQAGNAFERVGEWQQAIDAYDGAVTVSPEFAQTSRVGDRLIEVKALQARGAKAPVWADLLVPAGDEAASTPEAPDAESVSEPEASVDAGPAEAVGTTDAGSPESNGSGSSDPASEPSSGP